MQRRSTPNGVINITLGWSKEIEVVPMILCTFFLANDLHHNLGVRVLITEFL